MYLYAIQVRIWGAQMRFQTPCQGGTSPVNVKKRRVGWAGKNYAGAKASEDHKKFPTVPEHFHHIWLIRVPLRGKGEAMDERVRPLPKTNVKLAPRKFIPGKTAINPESVLPALLCRLAPSGSTTRLNHLSRDVHNDSQKTPKRIASLLDAIASISVENPKGDVVAVALDSGEDSSIFVASNTGVSTRLVAHLTSVWALLCQISKAVPADQGSPTLVNEIFRNDDIKELERRLTIQVYRFSWRKFYARFSKRVDVFIRSLTLVTKWYSEKPQLVEEHKRCSNLLRIFQNLRKRIVLSCPGDAELLRIHEYIITLTRSLEPHLSAPYSYLDTIQRGIDIHLDPGTFLPVRRYLEKVLSLTRSGYALFLAAHSRKLRPFLSRPLKQKIPTQFSELSDNLRDMVLDEEWKNRMVKPLGAALQKEKNSAIKADKRGLSGHARVHYECLLVAHFVKNAASLRPYDYIGLSKLLCYGCHSYFRAYNITHPTMRFYARGTHRKVYIPWVPPTLEDGS
ncbi:hypothetical protein HETIRDRAFT_427943 [Heterobasidion irregulare TC 32-1]|uniref:Uncharacterized protein n=1 Tax=Heterobasidion irregulare (strain TC 32-1) TaxID=747525 RepID=W4K756_HETIT|nr:uncharacterized protein HETIRDRAFT_427943 [Heterobasidion irregulare TC 32-1]ETW81175.1 hypothetical protein HETIRDRAFT_427943 [Heterobasidion irregulare TC 32-1]